MEVQSAEDAIKFAKTMGGFDRANEVMTFIEMGFEGYKTLSEAQLSILNDPDITVDERQPLYKLARELLDPKIENWYKKNLARLKSALAPTQSLLSSFNQEDWKIKDWHNKWLVHGLEPYKRFDKFLERHDFKQIYNALQVLSNQEIGSGTLREQFENGTFDPSESMWDSAERLMGELYDVAKVWNPGGAVYKSYFIGAYREVKFCSEFKHNTFIDRMTKYLSEMRECAKSKDYIDLINTIYNKGLKRENKVWLA